MKKFFFLVFLALSCFCGYTQTIDPVLLQEMGRKGDDEKIKVVVIMKPQYDRTQLQRRADYYATRAERREFVVNELKQFAEASQYDLRRSLDEMERQGMTTAPKIIWMANAMYFSATKKAINDMALRSDIELIGLDEKKQGLFDEEFSPASNTRGISSSVVQVKANQVWDLGYTGQGVVVAILDSGVNYNHPDLADHLWDGGTEYPHHGWDFSGDDDDPMDDHGHGTGCAGIVCGDGTLGCQTGVAPDATLMCVKVVDAEGNLQASVACEAMQWAVTQGADVLSMSMGLYNPSLTVRVLFRQTCAAVLDAGVVSTVAAGNMGANHALVVPNNMGVPAACPPPYMDPVQIGNAGGLSCVVCVGAVDADDQATDFTSHGPVTWADTEFGDYPLEYGSTTKFGLIRPDVCAPGKNIVSTSYLLSERYRRGDGTSCAAPCVAGCMALLLSKNQETTPAELCRVLEETAFSMTDGKSDTLGYGRVDAWAAVNKVSGHMGNIVFADPKVKEICVSFWDADGDGELSFIEAALVDSLKNRFQETEITSFDELRYFTGIKRVRPREFEGCVNLTSISIPNAVVSVGKGAFDGCDNLVALTMYAPRTANTRIPNLYPGVFDEANGALAIYVPYESLEEYKSENNNVGNFNNWSVYADRIHPWLQKSIVGYGTSTESNRWAFIASPIKGNTAASAIEGMIAETDYDLYRFNQGATEQWENYKSEDNYHFDLENGRGYLYATKEDTELMFKGSFNEEATQDVPLACSGGGMFEGWNLVGNPFPYKATVTGRSYYVMNAAGTAIAPTPMSSDATLSPCTGIFVKAESTEDNPVVTFSKPNTKSQSINQGYLQIDLSKADAYSEDIEDRAVVSFNEGDQLGKFYFGKNRASLYVPQGKEEYAIAVSEPSGTMPLNLLVKKEGRYTLTVKEIANGQRPTANYLHLVDHLTGADVDLLRTSDYTFTAKPSDYASRFLLVFSVNENDNENENLPFAFVSNGDIVVRGEGMLKVMDLLGRVIMTRELIPHSAFLIPHSTLASGVYVLQLICGEDLKTQKIVVR